MTMRASLVTVSMRAILVSVSMRAILASVSVRAILATLSATAIATGCLGLLPSPASAGSFVVAACSPSASAGMWTPTSTLPSVLGVGSRCGGPAIGPIDGGHDGGLWAEDVRPSATEIPTGARAGWMFSAPSGTTITAISYYRRLDARGVPGLVAGLYQADGTALEECAPQSTVPQGGDPACSMPNLRMPVSFTDLRTHALFLGVGCRAVRPSVACAAAHVPPPAARADLYSAQVTLSEDTRPALTNIGGELWSGGVVSGLVPVTFTASDASGISERAVRAAGDPLVSAPQACDFTVAQPCPQLPTASLTVDTTRVPDGPQTFSLAVTDAADNTQVATSPTVVVDNHGPPPPPELTATQQLGGSGAITLAWRNPADAPAPISRAMVQLCQASCFAATSAAPSGSATIVPPASGLYAVRLWLVDSRGKGGPYNAALAGVRVAPAATAPTTTSTKKPPPKIAAVLTGRRLRVSGTIARTGRVRVGWSAWRGGRTVASGTRLATIRDGALASTFMLPERARAATIRVTVTSGQSVLARVRARRG